MNTTQLSIDNTKQSIAELRLHLDYLQSTEIAAATKRAEADQARRAAQHGIRATSKRIADLEERLRRLQSLEATTRPSLV